MASLEVREVSKAFGSLTVLDAVSLEAADGEFLVLLGPSGCGKSTLLNMIAGLEPVTAGDILIEGRVVNDYAPKDRDIAMVFQSYALYPSMNVHQNMSFGMKVRGVPKAERDAEVKRVASLLQLDSLLDRRPHQLSGGQRQRVAMGRALVRDPKVFLFDEPLSNLDAKLRVEMRTELKKLHQSLGVTVVYVTHDQIEAMTLATKVVVMKGGAVQQMAAPQEIYDRPANLFVAGFIGSPPMNLIPGTLEEEGGNAVVRIARQEGDIRLAIGGFDGAMAAYKGKKILLGIRPEAITPDAGGAAPGTGFEALIDVIEPTGADNLAFMTLAGAEVIARLPPGTSVAGQRFGLKIDPARAMLFDPTTEQLIG
ncbi:MAG: sn-glycerol-3-phosphate ABC transporter ATP-binding protein UgpC [Bauldia sp.]|nr:sn-glycerol-3-phosphate ABC transporter ATP-binding protein UgpC [Bauldia sp.]